MGPASAPFRLSAATPRRLLALSVSTAFLLSGNGSASPPLPEPIALRWSDDVAARPASDGDVRGTDGSRQPARSCTSRAPSEKSRNWCIDNCVGERTSKAVASKCEQQCICHSWDTARVDWVLGFAGCLSVAACFTLLIHDIASCASSSTCATRPPSQAACLSWGNLCNLFYAVYYVLYAIGDISAPMRDLPEGFCDDAWLGLLGRASCNVGGHAPFCFLNCCIFAVPWLEFFGYSSLLWHIAWLFDLVRFTMQPLAPEKFMGIPLVAFYHLFTWLGAGVVAVDWNADRFTTAQCRAAEIVMVPCLLRRETLQEAYPWLHFLCFAFVIAATLLMAQRYSSVRRFSGNPGQDEVARSVRSYLRNQWFHAASLTLCCAIILVDTTRTCTEEPLSYLTAIGFAGLGCFLSLDRLVEAARPRCARGRWTSECYHVVDFAELLKQVREYLIEEQAFASGQYLPAHSGGCSRGADGQESLGSERASASHAGAAAEGSPASARLAALRAAARLDDHPEHHSDWTLTMRPGAGGLEGASLTVVAPRTFSYLRCLWGVDTERIASALQRSDAASLRTAAKSGCSLLITGDGRLVLKTVSELEVKQLRAMLSSYRKHMEAQPSSLLCHIFGCFTFRNGLGARLHVVLMDGLGSSPRSCRANTRAHGVTSPMSSNGPLEVARDHSWLRRSVSAVASGGTGVNAWPSTTALVQRETHSWTSTSAALAEEGDGPAGVQFDIKSEYHDGGFLQYFPGGLSLTSSAPNTSLALRDALAADLAFLSGEGVVDYSLLLTVFEASSGSTERPEESAAGYSQWKAAGSAGCYAARRASVSATAPTTGEQLGAKEREATLAVRLGLIDFLVPYTSRKRTESVLKRTLWRRDEALVTIVDPMRYAERQQSFLTTRVFPPEPAAASSSSTARGSTFCGASAGASVAVSSSATRGSDYSGALTDASVSTSGDASAEAAAVAGAGDGTCSGISRDAK